MPLDASVTIDSTTWAALALMLTVIGAAYSWIAWRRRGFTAGLRGLAWTLIPVAAWLTGTLKLAANILGDVVDWAARLVFSPIVWLGVVVGGVAGVLWVVSGILRRRGIGVRARATERRRAEPPQVASARSTKPAKPARTRKDDIDGMDEIEAILKKHGI
jgi:hypothetical protein